MQVLVLGKYADEFSALGRAKKIAMDFGDQAEGVLVAEEGDHTIENKCDVDDL